jgi:hypothetical protein
VLEFLRALAKRCCSSATAARREATSACTSPNWARKRRQLPQLVFLAMKCDYMHILYDGYSRERTPYRIQLVLEDDGWHVDYELTNPTLKGGGPHYVINAITGDIGSNRYEQ